MKIFEHMNTDDKCPICGTNEDKPVTLIGVVGTEEDNNMEAVQIHIDCLDLLYYPKETDFNSGLIVQRIFDEK